MTNIERNFGNNHGFNRETRPTVFACILIGVILFSSNPTAAQATVEFDEASKELIEREVSLDLQDRTITEAIEKVCEQTDMGLVIRAPKQYTEKRLTLRLSKMPARDVLRIVLENTGLSVKIQNRILQVDVFAESPGGEVSGVPTVPVTTPSSPSSDSHGGLQKQIHRIRDRIHGHRKASRVMFGKPIYIGPDETVDEAVSFGESVTIAGTVTDSAVSFGGSVILEPGAYIDGDAVSFGGTVEVPPGATVTGDRIAFGFPPDGTTNSKNETSDTLLPFLLPGIVGGLSVAGVLALLLRSAFLFVVALLFVWLMPGRINRVRDYLTERPLYSILGGVLLLVGLIPTILLLAVSIIGIPLIPLALLAFLALIIMGLSALLTWLGYKTPLFKNKKGPVGAMLLGLLAFALISLIPVVGAIFLTLSSFVAAGAALLSRFGGRRV